MIPNPNVKVCFSSKVFLTRWNRKYGTNFKLGDSTFVDFHKLKTSKDYRYKSIAVICDECGKTMLRTIKRINDGIHLCESCIQSGKRGHWYGTHRTDEQRIRQSERMSGSRNPYYGCKHTAEECEKSRIANIGNSHHKGKTHSKSTKDLISKKCLMSFEKISRKDTHKNQHSGEYKGKQYQGKLELSFLKHVEKIGFLQDVVRCLPVKYKWTDGSEHSYLPDYFIPRFDLAIEIKSGCYLERDKPRNMAKWNAASKQHKFVVVINNDFGEFDKIVKGDKK